MAARKKKGAQGASARARDALEESLRQLEKQLPFDLSKLVRQLRSTLEDLQAQVERMRADREGRWNRMQLQVRRDAARLFRRLEKAVEPPKTARKSRSRRKKTPSASPPAAPSA
jgi:hypothetical protein